jgi:transcriptional regulator with XRE-family HTH domain
VVPSASFGDSAPRGITDVPGGGPTVLRMMLGAQLRRLRDLAGITREDAGEAIRGSHAKISRLELGRVGFNDRAPLLALARRANEPGWWHKYGDLLPSWFETYVGLEQAATQVRTYEPQFVPGLLQTAAMARHVTQLGHHAMPADELARRVEFRLARQRILGAVGGPTLWAVVDEAALRRQLGGPDVMREQIDHLITMSERPNVVIQVVPFRFGGHAGAGGPFSILRFAGASDVPDIVYLEQLTSALYLDKRTDVDDYLATMDLLCVQALEPRETVNFLRDLRGELSDA